MLAIIGCLFGIFVGIAAAGYMLIQPLAERDKTIAEYKEQDEQLYEELKELRAELEDTKEDKEYLVKQLSNTEKIVNDFMTKEDKLNKIKELVDTCKTNN